MKSPGEMISKLKDPDVEVRLAALKSMAGSEEDRLIEWVIDALGDSEWRMRKTAVAIIVDLSDRNRVIDRLIGRLGGEKNVGMQNAIVEIFIQLGKASVDRLLFHLPGPDESIEKFIIDTLGEIKDARAVPALIRCVAEPKENVQASAIEALGKIRDASAVLPLLEVLTKEPSLSKFSAIKALGQIQDLRAVEPLIRILGQSMFRRAAVEALGALGDMKALSPLLFFFSSENRTNRLAALKAIVALESKQSDSNCLKIKEAVRKIYSEEMYVDLTEILNGSDKVLKAAGINVLGWLCETRPVPLLLPLLNSEFENIVSGGLVEMGQRAIVPIVSALAGQDEKIREKVALILGEIGDRQAIPILLELLNDRNGHVRSTAAAALGKIGDPQTIPFLFKVLADPYPDVQEAAVKALIEMKGDLPVPTLIGLLKNDAPHIRCNAALLLGQIKNDETIPSLSFLLKDPDENVRRSAVDALGLSDSPKIISHLIVAFGDEDHRVRLAALKVVERIPLEQMEKVIDYLGPLLHDSNIWVRAAIPRILGRVSGEKILKLLLELMEDEIGAVRISVLAVLGNRKEKMALSSILEQTSSSDMEVKKAAILALGKMGDPSVLPSLRSFLSDPHWTVRVSAVQAIGALGDPASRSRLAEMTVSDDDPLVRAAAKSAMAQIEQDGGSK